MFVKNSDIPPTALGGGVSRKILGMGGSLMMVEVTFSAGGIGAPHAHPHEQVSYLVKGEMEFTLAGETRILHAGDSVYIPANALHGTVAVTDAVILDVFTPIREDFLAK